MAKRNKEQARRKAQDKSAWARRRELRKVEAKIQHIASNPLLSGLARQFIQKQYGL